MRIGLIVMWPPELTAMNTMAKKRTVDFNQMNTMPGNDYVVGGNNEVVETTTVVQEEIIILPGAPMPMAQQPQQIIQVQVTLL